VYVTLPVVGRRSRTIVLINVVFPEPFGPITATTAPAGIETDTPESARTPPNDFERSSVRSTVSPA